MPNVTYARCIVYNGKAYVTVAEAQTEILRSLFTICSKPQWDTGLIVEKILDEREAILGALSLQDPPREVRKGRPKGSKNKPKSPELPGIQPKAA